jgi:hypothetical protein
MERWKIGMMDDWNNGTIEYWKIGRMEAWKSGLKSSFFCLFPLFHDFPGDPKA